MKPPCTRMERLALREEGKEACARAEVSETAEMGGETVERVKPPCTRMERRVVREEGKEACARAGGWWWGGHRDDPTGTFYPHDPSFTPLPFTPLVHKLSSSSS